MKKNPPIQILWVGAPGREAPARNSWKTKSYKWLQCVSYTLFPKKSRLWPNWRENGAVDGDRRICHDMWWSGGGKAAPHPKKGEVRPAAPRKFCQI